MKIRSGGQFVFAVIFVLVGIMLLLVNLGIISVEINEAIYFLFPFVIAILGLKLLIESIFSKSRRGSWFWGLILTALGSLLIVDRFGYIDFDIQDIWKLWPILIVYIGLKMLWGRGSIHFKHEKWGKAKGKRSNVGNLVTDVSMKDDNWQVEPIEEWNGVADYDFDFTKAFIPDKDTPINLSGWVGDIKIFIPEDVEFAVTSNTKVGSIKIGNYKKDGMMKNSTYKSEGYESATRKITFDFSFKVLDLRINRV
ncbi:cell wall-active antibiotics response protein LiaF [Alkalihalobacillus sp. AL-G]|uniref:cell wall-active antibiotics response protein LiaF n=1 Tax=Alkalihalobacillus sp. AL-G TaxID=2926399 RepID=UPI0027297393|nr:cell wall-active antibiotics response protein LiaF [Alkalihalobacillus sp. AL-G]WLD92512.1 cell wall-active antibiotics response protein LiaF [Alkalihalobacillus sp. AL-G]